VAATSDVPVRLTLLSRAWCHLCDEMREELAQLGRVAPFDLEIVDVDADPVLEDTYGDDVPVLLAGTIELCRHRLDANRVAAYLESCGKDQARTGQIG
jgi:thiol-disulfide isomerase/thioredoxin